MTDFTREESWVQHVDDLSAKQSATTVGKYYPHEMVEALIVAVWSAAWHIGAMCGIDQYRAAGAGEEPSTPASAEEAYHTFVGEMDIFSPEEWGNVT